MQLVGNKLTYIVYVEIKCQLDATEVFIADLIACSTCFGHHYAHHQELKSIIQWLLPLVFRALVFKLLVWCGADGYVSDSQAQTGHIAVQTKRMSDIACKGRHVSSFHQHNVKCLLITLC